MPKKSTRTCPECGGTMRHESRKDTIEYKGHTKSVTTKAWWCSSCDESVLEGEDLLANEAAFQALKADVDGILTAQQVAAARKKLRLSQRKAGEVLGGGPRAFQKYESGKVMVSAPMSNLLRLLSNDPSRLQELQDDTDQM